jgi:hypothetical protein
VIRSRHRVALAALLFTLGLAPGVAMAVRPSVSGSLVRFVGSDPDGLVTLTIFVDSNQQRISYAISDMRFATECSPSGTPVPGTIRLSRSVTDNRPLRFRYRRAGVTIKGRLSGRAGGPKVTGTVQFATAGCETDVLPFSAKPR